MGARRAIIHEGSPANWGVRSSVAAVATNPMQITVSIPQPCTRQRKTSVSLGGRRTSLAFGLGIGYGFGGKEAVVRMTTEDTKPGAEPPGPTDPLSATGIFLNAFRTQSDQSEERRRESRTACPPSPASREGNPAAPGEFTQLFGAIKPAAPAPVQPPLPSPPRQEAHPQAAEETTRVFVRQVPPPSEQPPKAASPPITPAQRMKGFSSPGASDFGIG